MKTNRLLSVALLGIAALMPACGASTAGGIDPRTGLALKPGESPSSGPRESPPPSGIPKASPFPKIEHQTLSNGLGVDVVELHTLPIVQLRLVLYIHQGSAAPNVASMTAQMLKDGGTRSMKGIELLERIETLGANTTVYTRADSTVFELGVPRSTLKEALGLLGEMIQSPRFDDEEFRKLKARETDEAAGFARSSGSWSAQHVLFQRLFGDESPYRVSGATPAQIATITNPVVRDFYKKFYVPKNATLIIAGDVQTHEVVGLVDGALGGWKGGDPPIVKFPPPVGITAGRHVIITHRAESAQSDILVAGLVGDRTNGSWPALKVVTQLVGGVPSGRLFADLREQRSLAYSARANVVELAHGPQPLVLSVGTQTPKTGLAVQGILENLTRLRNEPLPAEEVRTASRYLSDVFAQRMETVGSIADLMASARSLGLPDGYWDRYRADLLKVTDTAATSLASQLIDPESLLIVVSGDAPTIEGPLSHFGNVTVVDPEHDFKTLRTLPMNLSAPLEAPVKSN